MAGMLTHSCIARWSAGTIPTPEGDYEACALLGSDTPCVRNPRTGRLFVLPWSDLLELARQAGIDVPEEVPSGRQG